MLNLAKWIMTLKLKIGEVWLANLNPSKGTEPGKTRPVLILQDQALLDIAHPSTLVVPLTTRLIDDDYPLRVRVKMHNKLEKNFDLLIDQVRAIDNKRFVSGPLTKLTPTQLKPIFAAVCEVMGIDLETMGNKIV